MLPNKKKVAFILPDLSAGGAQRVLINIANNLNTEEFDPFIISLTKNRQLESMVKGHVHVIFLDKKRVILAALSLLKVLKKHDVKYALSTIFHVNFCLLLLRPFLQNVKIIVREANMVSYILSRQKLVYITRFLYKFLYPKADKIISPANIITQELAFLLPREEDKMQVVYNPVVQCAQTLSVKVNAENSVKFIASGRLNYQKGFDRLIKLLGNNDLPYKWSLDILGEGEEKENLETLIVSYDLNDKIKLKGYVNDPSSLYASADCLLLPSRSEGLPNVVLESLSCGTPVIAMAEAGGIEEIACHAFGNIKIAYTMKEFYEFLTSFKKTAYKNVTLPKAFKIEHILTQYEALFN